MAKIKVMSASLANKIAAGEVVERPVSVVKELVENSIDAGATKIDIFLTQEGITEIKIVDNGEGMSRNDAPLAFLRHATSKLSDEADLYKIMTLGFRGEALPSVAAVSKVYVKTNNGTESIEFSVIDGEVSEILPSPSRQGTTLEVKHLFYNTPARLKYLKSMKSELSKIVKAVQEIALSHNEIALTLSNDGKELFRSNGANNLLQVISFIYGMNVVKEMVPVSYNDLNFKITGFISKPIVNRTNRNYISLIINGRTVKNYGISKAIINGYGQLIPHNRYPIAMLKIDVDPSTIDVNVHPSKTEIRISLGNELESIISRVISETFEIKEIIQQPILKPKSENNYIEQKIDFTFQKEMVIKETPELVTEKIIEVVPPKKQRVDININVESPPVVEVEENIIIETSKLPTMFPIGQVHGTYIVAQSDSSMYLIDQHAAMERINYERYYLQLGNPIQELVDLLVPIVLEYSSEDFMKIIDKNDEIEAFGIKFEQFGFQTIKINAHPNWFPKDYEKQAIENIFEAVIRGEHLSVHRFRDNYAILLSCKLSLKANDNLEILEMEELIRRLSLCNNPLSCPHGRPTIIEFSEYELEKLFKRVM